MEIKKMYELPCLDNRKSFYGCEEIIENINEELLVMCDIPTWYVDDIDISLEFLTMAGYKEYTKKHLKSLYKLLKKSNYKAKCDNENLVDLLDMVKDVILDFTFE